MEDKKVEDQISNVLEKGQTTLKPENKDLMMAVGVGLGAAVLGAIIWYLIAIMFNIQLGYIAILIGFMVGTGMKMFLKSKNSIMFGFIAVGLTLFGMLLGKYMIWYFALPNWFKQEVAVEYDVTVEEVADEYSDADIRELYPFNEYLADDLTPSGDSSTEQKGSVLILFAYLFSLYYAFVSVYQIKKNDKKI